MNESEVYTRKDVTSKYYFPYLFLFHGKKIFLFLDTTEKHTICERAYKKKKSGLTIIYNRVFLEPYKPCANFDLLISNFYMEHLWPLSIYVRWKREYTYNKRGDLGKLAHVIPTFSHIFASLNKYDVHEKKAKINQRTRERKRERTKTRDWEKEEEEGRRKSRERKK